jgi:heme oxygenase
MLVDALRTDRPSVDSARPGLRDKLKRATAAAHRSLDAQFSTFDLTGIRGYRRFLEASAAALLPLEAALEEAGVTAVFRDWPERSRRAAIKADLERLSGAAHPLCDVEPLSRNALLGVMYVLEGSRLGAKFLLRAHGGGDPRIAEAASYLRHGADRPLWRTFLLRLESEPVTGDDEAEIIRGAHLAFAMFAEAAARA